MIQRGMKMPKFAIGERIVLVSDEYEDWEAEYGVVTQYDPFKNRYSVKTDTGTYEVTESRMETEYL